MATDGGTKAVLAALMANTGIALTKFVAFVLTASSSMLAESIHSVSDASNQGLLLLGVKRAQREATEKHPFGYGRERYVYSFIVAIVLFSVGGLFALYEAAHKWQEVKEHPGELGDLDGRWWWVPIAVLIAAILMEGLSLRTAVIETNKIRGDAGWASFIRHAKQPELPVILLEDVAALLGLVFALLGVGLSLLTGSLVFDVLGTGAIGVLLVAVAIVLAIETKSLLLGESAAPAVELRIRSALQGTSGFQQVIHLKTLHLGPDELLVAAKVAVEPSATSADVVRAIDAAERAIRAAEPTAQVIYLEPDIFVERHLPDPRPEPQPPASH